MATVLHTTSIALALACVGAARAQTCDLRRVSEGPQGLEADQASGASSLSRDGRYVAFSSSATNLVANDTNGTDDVFVHDRVLGVTERVSVDSAGNQSNVQSSLPSISGDGRYVVFSSWAYNLVPNDTNNTNDVFLHDRALHTTVRVSEGVGGVQGNNGSYQGSISRNGRWITFLSSASNLVPLDSNDARDVFLLDRETGALELVSVSSAGLQGNGWAGGSSGGPFASDDGRFVAFQSAATNLVAGDTNGFVDVFVRDRGLATTTRVVLGVGGLEPDGATDVTSFTPDGRRLGLVSFATNLVANDTNGQYDSFVLDRTSGLIERVSVSSSGSEATGSSWSSVISDDGRFVVFSDTAADLVPNDTNGRRDVFRRDLFVQTTELVSRSIAFSPADADCFHPTISGDGTATAFASASTQLVPFDVLGFSDVFVQSCRSADYFCTGTATACPCANAGSENAGCGSATTPGAQLHAVGSTSVAADTLTLVAFDVTLDALVAFLDGAGPSVPPAGIGFGDGLLCLSPPNHVLGVRRAVGHIASFGFLPGDPLISVASSIPNFGGTGWYQVWYRSAENFCTSATYNLSNGAAVLWSP